MTNGPRRFFLLEIWLEYRSIFKAIIGHALTAGFIVSLLALLHFFAGLIGLPPEYKALVNTVDLICYVAALAILVVGFLCEVIVFTYRRLKR